MIYIDSGQRNNHAIRPSFGITMIIIFWLGCFLVFSFNNNVSLLLRFALASLLTSFLLVPGMWLFQNYSIKINKEYALWESTVFPFFWTESWREPICNYAGIEILHSTPIREPWRYKPSTLNYPLKRFRGDRNSQRILNEI